MALAERGIPSHPFLPIGGRLRPGSPLGRKDATRDPVQIERWVQQGALFAIATGPESGLWVLDLDQPCGPAWLSEQMRRRGIECPSEVTGVWGASKSGGLHAYFRFDAGCPACSRASDIAPDVDTRARGGSIIAPGNKLADGRGYDLLGLEALAAGRIVRLALTLDEIAERLLSAPTAPRWLSYLAAFSAAERAVIAASPDLREAIRAASPAEWSGILNRHQAAKRTALAERMAWLPLPHDTEGMRAQALHDLREAASAFATLQDGRRTALFRTAARLARYVANSILTEDELRSALRDAASANGATGAHGAPWAEACISRALKLGANDPLPLLAQRFRSGRYG